MLESAKLISIFFPSFMVNFIAASSQEVDRLVADMVGVRDVKQNIISLLSEVALLEKKKGNKHLLCLALCLLFYVLLLS
jgi:hypothetical protein